MAGKLASNDDKTTNKQHPAHQTTPILHSLYRISTDTKQPAAAISEGRLKAIFYPGSAMGMNIKDPQVHAMAKELAARRGTSVTDAVRQALKQELERSHTGDAARQEELQALLARFRQLHWPEGVSSKEAQDALYDDQGLPA